MLARSFLHRTHAYTYNNHDGFIAFEIYIKQLAPLSDVSVILLTTLHATLCGQDSSVSQIHFQDA